MDALREWALAVCAAAVAGSLVCLLCPAGEAAKAYKVTVSVFLLCVILSPVITGVLGSDWGYADISLNSKAEENTDVLNAMVEAQIENDFYSTVKDFVNSKLAEINAVPEEIYINVNTNDESGIFIKELTIVTCQNDKNKQAEITALLSDSLGIKPVFKLKREE
ncbi:MAG: hypothetical protein RR115_01530 [Hydrogenoanaerobacterium sp.]